MIAELIRHLFGMPTKRNTRNKFENEIHKSLKLKKKFKVSYETEKLPYIIRGNYIPDFMVTTKSGRTVYIEAKGHFRPEAKRKMAAVRTAHPDLDIRFIFYKKKLADIKFALKYNFPYAIGGVPDEWFEEFSR